MEPHENENVGPLLKSYQASPDGNSRALNPVQGRSEHSCTGRGQAQKPALGFVPTWLSEGASTYADLTLPVAPESSSMPCPPRLPQPQDRSHPARPSPSRPFWTSILQISPASFPSPPLGHATPVLIDRKSFQSAFTLCRHFSLCSLLLTYFP